MKRTPLKKKSILKSISGLTRSAINIVSKGQIERYKKYKHLKTICDQGLIACKRCGKKGFAKDMDMHHPNGRRGEHLFVFFPLCRSCHILIHSDEQRAIENGWINNK